MCRKGGREEMLNKECPFWAERDAAILVRPVGFRKLLEGMASQLGRYLLGSESEFSWEIPASCVEHGVAVRAGPVTSSSLKLTFWPVPNC
jgi:hypothetical protein